MKIVVLILLVLAGIFLYQRAKRLATDEQKGRQSGSSDAAAQPAEKPVETPESKEVQAEPTAAQPEPQAATPDIQAVAAEVQVAAVEPQPAVPEVQPAVPEVQPAVVDIEQTSAEPVVSQLSTQVEAVVDAVPEPKPEPKPEPEPEPEPDAQKAKPAAVVVPPFAATVLATALNEFNAASSAEIRFQSLQQAIGECYRQRKDADHLALGATLAAEFAGLIDELLAQGKDIKGNGFMQLATLLTDKGEFDGAIGLCRRALALGLSDGTVTGFEGRISRIEKARDKLAAK